MTAVVVGPLNAGQVLFTPEDTIEAINVKDALLELASEATPFGAGFTDGVNVSLTYQSHWGITSGGGVPYYSTNIITTSEAALLVVTNGPVVSLVQAGPDMTQNPLAMVGIDGGEPSSTYGSLINFDGGTP